jgi:hypothetical protein
MLRIVGPSCHSGRVRVMEADIARVPVTNLRVPRAEFGAPRALAHPHDLDVSSSKPSVPGSCEGPHYVMVIIVAVAMPAAGSRPVFGYG